jgi:hypothetical protein
LIPAFAQLILPNYSPTPNSAPGTLNDADLARIDVNALKLAVLSIPLLLIYWGTGHDPLVGLLAIGLVIYLSRTIESRLRLHISIGNEASDIIGEIIGSGGAIAVKAASPAEVVEVKP